MATFTITELRRTGAGLLEPTSTVLRWTSGAHSAPRGVLEYELAATTVRKELPGSDQPVEQVMAVASQPFDLQGVWDDRYAGAGFARRADAELRRLAGKLVRIQLDRLSWVALLTHVKVGYMTEDRRSWAITVSPHRDEAGGDARRATAAPALRPISHHVASVDAGVAQAEAGQAAASTLPLTTELHEDAGGDVNALTQVTARLRAAASSGLEADVARRLLGIGALFRGVRGAAMAIPQRFATARSTAQVAYDDVISTLRYEGWVRTLAADARRVALGAERGAGDARIRARQRPRAIHRARAGESLQRISQQYYGTPAGWRGIYEANGLASMTLTGAEELIIPERGP